MSVDWGATILKKQGYRSFFYKKIDVNWSNFGGGATDNKSPDIIITFPTQSLLMLNESTTGIVEYSFAYDGITEVPDGELDPNLPSRSISLDNFTASLIWFRVKPGSSGPIKIRIDAWPIR